MRLIDRDRLLKIFRKMCWQECAVCPYNMNDYACQLIEKAPFIDTERTSWRDEMKYGDIIRAVITSAYKEGIFESSPSFDDMVYEHPGYFVARIHTPKSERIVLLFHLNHALTYWLWENAYSDVIIALMRGNIDALTDDIWNGYTEWACSQEGLQYHMDKNNYSTPDKERGDIYEFYFED